MDWKRYLKTTPEEISKQEPSKVAFGPTVLMLVEIRAVELEEASRRLSDVVDSVLSNNGTVLQIMSSLVLARFDQSFEKQSASELELSQVRCETTLRILQDQLGGNVRIISGVCSAAYGNFGSAKRMSYGPFVKDFTSIMSRLSNLEFGGVARI